MTMGVLNRLIRRRDVSRAVRELLSEGHVVRDGRHYLRAQFDLGL